jgi:hypothetical protein
MKVFLNRYMATNRDLERQSDGELTDAFVSTIELLRRAKGDRVFRIKSAINAAVFESVMTGMAQRIARGAVSDLDALADAYDRLLADEDYLFAVSRATADEENVSTRLAKAHEAFAAVP